MSEEKDTTFRDKLAEAIAETMKLQAVVDQASKRILELAGKQEALSELWLDGEELELQEAFDTNHDGLKDKVEELKK